MKRWPQLTLKIFWNWFATENPYETLGCWKDAIPRAMQTLERNSNESSILDGHYKRRQNSVEKCYKAALSLRFRIFALQDGGHCSVSSSSASYKKNGPSKVCSEDGTGGPMANDVYKMVDGMLFFNFL